MTTDQIFVNLRLGEYCGKYDLRTKVIIHIYISVNNHVRKLMTYQVNSELSIICQVLIGLDKILYLLVFPIIQGQFIKF